MVLVFFKAAAIADDIQNSSQIEGIFQAFTNSNVQAFTNSNVQPYILEFDPKFPIDTSYYKNSSIAENYAPVHLTLQPYQDFIIRIKHGITSVAAVRVLPAPDIDLNGGGSLFIQDQSWFFQNLSLGKFQVYKTANVEHWNDNLISTADIDPQDSIDLRWSYKDLVNGFSGYREFDWALAYQNGSFGNYQGELGWMKKIIHVHLE